MLNLNVCKKLIYMFFLCLLSGCGYSSSTETQDNGQGINNVDSEAIQEQETELPRLEDLTGNPQFSYQGAFRIDGSNLGVSSIQYAVGILAYNPVNHSLFIAGHAQHNALAEFSIPEPLDKSTVLELNVAAPLQNFVAPLDAISNPDKIDRITGMLYVDGQLIVNAERWYDASGNADDTTLVLRDAQNIVTSKIDGYYELASRAQGAGYMSPIPLEWQSAFGATHLTGWSNVNSIISRYSVGPSLWTFDTAAILNDAGPDSGPVVATAFMNFPHAGQNYIVPDALNVGQGPGVISPVYNYLSGVRYGFIVPGTRTFVALGSSGGIDSGIGYKITQDNGNLCGGHCAYSANDRYNYYWLFDLSEILGAAQVHEPQPYAYGKLSIPFDKNGEHRIKGGAFDPDTGTLYLALYGAGQTGEFDRPPLIVVYKFLGV